MLKEQPPLGLAQQLQHVGDVGARVVREAEAASVRVVHDAPSPNQRLGARPLHLEDAARASVHSRVEGGIPLRWARSELAEGARAVAERAAQAGGICLAWPH